VEFRLYRARTSRSSADPAPSLDEESNEFVYGKSGTNSRNTIGSSGARCLTCVAVELQPAERSYILNHIVSREIAARERAQKARYNFRSLTTDGGLCACMVHWTDGRTDGQTESNGAAGGRGDDCLCLLYTVRRSQLRHSDERPLLFGA